MHVAVNGVRLYVDVMGAGLVPDGVAMRERPVIVMVHGGPGADHTVFKPAFGQLADVAQMVFYDQRGNGRSEGDEPADWTLAQWADDLRGLCDTLGIVRPVVLGTSFGGFVAQAYAVRHPGHAAALILISTAARMEFERVFATFGCLGGPKAEALARAYWTAPTAALRQSYRETCLPLYQRAPWPPGALSRIRFRDGPALHFNGPGNEHGRMDHRAGLASVTCPVLVMAGEDDPIVPVALSETMAACLTRAPVTFRRYPDCGHGVTGDRPAEAFAEIRAFLARLPIRAA
ncbi:MAG: alpha/beta fold hydrolase [Gemmobacter sp.]